MLNRPLVGLSKVKIRENRENEDTLCQRACMLCLSIVIWSHECPWTYLQNPYCVWMEIPPLALSSFMHRKLGTGTAHIKSKIKYASETWISCNTNMIVTTVSETE